MICMTYESLVKNTENEETLQYVNSAEAVLCCIQEDEFSIQNVFNTLFKMFKENADKYDNLLSTVIYFIDKDDYKKIVDEKPKVFEQKPDQLD